MKGSFSHLTNGFIRNSNVKLKLAILGAPGSGKSTLAAGLLYFCKLFQFRVDAVPEVAKWDYYKNVNFENPDYEYNKFKAQQQLESIYPEDLEVTICEAPLVISSVYAAYYYGNRSKVASDMFKKALVHADRYTHFFVSRKLITFEEFGRNETEQQCDELHQKTLEILESLGLNYTLINRYDEHVPIQILQMVGAIYKGLTDKPQPTMELNATTWH